MKCKNCYKPEGEHKAVTKNCPVGRKTRVGYINYNFCQVYEAPDKKTEYKLCWACSRPFRGNQKFEAQDPMNPGLTVYVHKACLKDIKDL